MMPEYMLERLTNQHRYFPARAIDRGVSGIADLCCNAREDRTLECRVARQWPRRAGFGRYARQLAAQLRLTEEGYEAVLARNNPPMLLSTDWIVEPAPPELNAQLAAARADVSHVCGEKAVDLGPIQLTARVLSRHR